MKRRILLWKYKLPFLFAFFLCNQFDAWAVAVSAAVLMGVVGEQGFFVIAFIKKILIFYPTLGVFTSFLHYQFARPEEYYFFHNGACSKLDLWLFTFLLASLISLFLYSLCNIVTLWI